MPKLPQNDPEKQGLGVLRIAMDGGHFAEVAIVEHVKLLGVSGFVVTRGVIGDEDYKVSCVRTGFCCGAGSIVSPKAAVKRAEDTLRKAADSRGVTPVKFMEWSRRRARALLKRRANG